MIYDKNGLSGKWHIVRRNVKDAEIDSFPSFDKFIIYLSIMLLD